jgi:hypothetical protein
MTMIQVTVALASETMLCKRYEGKLKRTLKMLTIKSELVDTSMYSRGTDCRLGGHKDINRVTGVKTMRQMLQTDGS